ncbi:hypothetical protein CVT25_002251 [Psilocybe cyanescens]|uniref:Uncharacterized protein n=1 Tax=Psilocybe cyanescens TaxID=93625 RepID=A0A409X5S5_PSICY|nr:hypothetical protein CVT25_002251 [Psilocybe cyanescens]
MGVENKAKAQTESRMSEAGAGRGTIKGRALVGGIDRREYERHERKCEPKVTNKTPKHLNSITILKLHARTNAHPPPINNLYQHTNPQTTMGHTPPSPARNILLPLQGPTHRSAIHSSYPYPSPFSN